MADECTLVLAPLGVVHRAGGDARRLLGVEPRRLVGVGIVDLVRPADRVPLYEAMRAAVLRHRPGSVRCQPAIRTAVDSIELDLTPRLIEGGKVGSWVVRVRECDVPGVGITLGDTSALRSWAIERGLRTGEFDLDLQPIVNVADRQTVGFEALVRWARPGLGRVPASQFLPAVEAAGLMSELGLKVLDLAVQRLSLWAVTSPERDLSVNVSPSELLRPGFVEDVASIVENGGIDPQRLTLEFAFNPISADQLELAHVMSRLHNVAGVKLAIDDYAAPGMYSPANVLPVDVLKFDRSITDAVTRSAHHRLLLGSLVALVRSAGREVIATGVESDEQIQAVADIGVNFAQGYLLGAPEPIEPGVRQGVAARRDVSPSTRRIEPSRRSFVSGVPRLPERREARPTWPPPPGPPATSVPAAPAARQPVPTTPAPPGPAKAPTPRPGVPIPSWPVQPAATVAAPEVVSEPGQSPPPEVSPAAGLRLVPDDATGRGLVFERADGRWSFRVLGPDGEPVAEGAERGYTTRGEARRVVEQLLQGAFDGPVDDLR